MALERIDLTGCLSVEEACSKLLFSDVTGFVVTSCNDEYNEEGYGLEGGIELDDVTSAVLNVYFVGQTVPITFSFTIVNHVITACTLTDLNGVVIDITSLLESTVFPLTDFDINADYGVTIPSLTDGIIKWDYAISGTSDDESFEYTTSGGIGNDCEINCCIENKYLELDPNCDCSADKKRQLIDSEVFLWGFRYAINAGQDSKAQGFLDNATEICNKNCNC